MFESVTSREEDVTCNSYVTETIMEVDEVVKLLNKVAHQEGIVGLYGAHEVSNAHGRAVVMLLFCL